jgi:magnesium transporter
MDTRLLDRGADFLLYNVLDLMVDNHFPILDQIEDRIDEIHDYIFDNPSPRLLDELLHLKRDLNIIRRYSIPQRELFNQISRGDLQFVKRDHLIYYRDIYDHMFRISESIDIERDLTAMSMDAYLSVIANRTNETMKVLTIISTILLPMNFIASIYGMNFLHIPELQWKYGYVFALIVMGTIGFGFLMWFARKGWLWPNRSEQVHKERALRKLLRRKGRPGTEMPQSFGPRPPLDRASGTSVEKPENERRRYARTKRKHTK